MNNHDMNKWYISFAAGGVAVSVAGICYLATYNPVVLVILATLATIALVMSSRNVLSGALMVNDIVTHPRANLHKGPIHGMLPYGGGGDDVNVNVSGMPMLGQDNDSIITEYYD